MKPTKPPYLRSLASPLTREPEPQPPPIEPSAVAIAPIQPGFPAQHPEQQKVDLLVTQLFHLYKSDPRLIENGPFWYFILGNIGSELSKWTHKEADYLAQSPFEQKNCTNCIHARRIAVDTNVYECMLVQSIQFHGWCKHHTFKAR